MTTKLRKVSRSCATALAQLATCGLLPLLNAHAQVPPRVERVSGVWRASLSTLPVTTAYWYATPGEAFAAHAAWWAASATPPYTRQAFNFRPCSGTQQYGYFNGVPHSWCHDYRFFTAAFFNTAALPAPSRGIRFALKIGRAYMSFRLRVAREGSHTKFDSRVSANYRPHNVRCLLATA